MLDAMMHNAYVAAHDIVCDFNPCAVIVSHRAWHVYIISYLAATHDASLGSFKFTALRDRALPRLNVLCAGCTELNLDTFSLA